MTLCFHYRAPILLFLCFHYFSSLLFTLILCPSHWVSILECNNAAQCPHGNEETTHTEPGSQGAREAWNGLNESCAIHWAYSKSILTWKVCYMIVLKKKVLPFASDVHLTAVGQNQLMLGHALVLICLGYWWITFPICSLHKLTIHISLIILQIALLYLSRPIEL